MESGAQYVCYLDFNKRREFGAMEVILNSDADLFSAYK